MQPAVAITAINKSQLICHYFDSEAELLIAKPYVRRWTRETFDKRHIRYHSKQAEEYWRSRKLNDPIVSLSIYYKNGKEVSRENQK